MAGWFALLAQKQAAKNQRIRERETEIETIRGTLQAIEAEVELFKAKFLEGFEMTFKEPESPLAYLPKIVSIKQNLSVVFDSNTAVLGRITDATLRRKIVATYLRLKATLDVVNHYAERREFWDSVRYQPSTGGV